MEFVSYLLFRFGFFCRKVFEKLASKLKASEEIPTEFKCPICKRVIKEAVQLPCCSSNFCDLCKRKITRFFKKFFTHKRKKGIREELDRNSFTCPVCKKGVESLESLKPNEKLRASIKNYNSNSLKYNLTISPTTHNPITPPTSHIPTIPPTSIPQQNVPPSKNTNSAQPYDPTESTPYDPNEVYDPSNPPPEKGNNQGDFSSKVSYPIATQQIPLGSQQIAVGGYGVPQGYGVQQSYAVQQGYFYPPNYFNPSMFDPNYQNHAFKQGGRGHGRGGGRSRREEREYGSQKREEREYERREERREERNDDRREEKREYVRRDERRDGREEKREYERRDGRKEGRRDGRDDERRRGERKRSRSGEKKGERKRSSRENYDGKRDDRRNDDRRKKERRN